MSNKPVDWQQRLAVYLVADPEQTRRDLVDDVTAALAGGVTTVQMRAKQMPDRPALSLALRLRDLCHEHHALFIVNDRLDWALACDADGIHVGINDLPVDVVRRIAGPDLLVGSSPQTDEEVMDAAKLGADYIGLGPVYPTGSKADAGEAIGLGTLRHRVKLTDLPAVGIGGINATNAGDVIRAGAVGVSVISAILSASDPKAAAAALVRAVNDAS